MMILGICLLPILALSPTADSMFSICTCTDVCDRITFYDLRLFTSYVSKRCLPALAISAIHTCYAEMHFIELSVLVDSHFSRPFLACLGITNAISKCH